MPALGARSHWTISLRDATGEMTTSKFYGVNLTAISYGGQLTLQGALESAIDAVTLGAVAKDAWGVEDVSSNDVPANLAAQRESKLLVNMRGVTSEYPFTVTIGTIDFDQLAFVPGAGDVVPLDASAGIIALVDAINDFARNPNNVAEAAEVVSLRYVGRNT